MPNKGTKTTKGKGKRLPPLLRSALEVLDHSLHHFFRSNTAKDMRFALMHIDQSIELLLKERVRSGGKSIYKGGSKETISMWAAYDILEKEFKLSIPEKPDLEILHDERNKIQHGVSNPSSEDASFHVDKAMEFIQRFTKDELKIQLSDFIKSTYLENF